MGMQVYTNIRNFREDLTRYPPAFFVCVPLVLDTLHSRVRSPAGTLQQRVQDFAASKPWTFWNGGTEMCMESADMSS
jgi:hypothetical protein